MALTAKPMTTISYNSELFLRRKLDEMFSCGKIEDYRYIRHEPEEDEKKAHFHVIIYPNRRIDTVDIRNEFLEDDPLSDKPLGCLPFRTKSDPFHWLMYVLHDPLYLIAHNADNDGDGKIEYTIDEVVTPFEEQLRRDYKKAVKLRQTQNQMVIDAVQQGLTMTEICYMYNVKPLDVKTLVQIMRVDVVKAKELQQKSVEFLENKQQREDELILENKLPY